MRIVILYNTCWYVFLLRRNLIKYLRERGVEVTVVAPTDQYTDRVVALGVRHIPITMSPRSTNPFLEGKTFRQILDALKIVQPHFVLSFTIKCNLYAGLCSYLLKFRQIANVSGLGEGFDKPGILNALVGSLYRVALRRTHRVFFQNPEDLDMCIRNRLVPNVATRLLPGSGVDLSLFSPSHLTDMPERTFLMFGRLLPKKGFYRFLTAAQEIKKRHGARVRLRILGSADRERPESIELLTAIEAAHAAGTIEYLPPTDDVLPIVNAAHVVVLPSTYNEGVPRSLLEALACGKPVVTTDWKGCRETVEDGVNGYLVKPAESTDALISALDRLVTCTLDELKQMGRASRTRAEQHFDERIVMDEYLGALSLPVIGPAPLAA